MEDVRDESASGIGDGPSTPSAQGDGDNGGGPVPQDDPGDSTPTEQAQQPQGD